MSLFFKNKNNSHINPATEDTLAGVKAQSDLLSFDSVATTAPNAGNLTVDVASAANVAINNAGGAPIRPATLETLSVVQAQVKNLSFDPNDTNPGLNTTNAMPTLDPVLSVKDTTTANTNSAANEKLVLWRRMVKLMESQQARDFNQNQRLTIDGFGGDVITGTGVSGQGVPMLTIASDSTITTGVVTGLTSGITSYVGWNDQMFQDVARNNYARSIRRNLKFK